MSTIGTYEAKAYPLQFALYLEGIRVPFIRATVKSSVNQPSTCTIELPPFNSATQIRPRTLVHLFYWDSPFVNKELTQSDTAYPDWRLLFEGEVTHITVTQREDYKTVGLVCQDFTNYWYHVYQAFLNQQSLSKGCNIEAALFLNGTTNSIGVSTIYNVQFPQLFGDIVSSAVLGGFNGIADDGTFVPPTPRGNPLVGLLDLLTFIPQINKFFKDAQTRLKMNERIFLFPDFELTRYFNVAVTAIRKIGDQFTAGIGQTGTVASVIQKFLNSTFYDYVSFPAPPYGPNPALDSKYKDGVDILDDTVLPKNIKTQGTTPVILNTIFKPRTTFCVAPRCNILFPNRLSEFHYSKSFLDEPTRLRMKLEITNTKGMSPGDVGGLEPVVYAPPLANINTLGTIIPAESTILNKEAEDSKLVKDKVDLIKNDVSKVGPALAQLLNLTKKNYGNYTDGANLVFDTKRDISEPECGIVPDEAALDFNQTVLVNLSANDTAESFVKKVKDNVNTAGTDINTLIKFYLAAADYALDLKKFGFRAVTGIRGPFNPNLLVGFPGVLMSSIALFLGDIGSVTHVLDSTSGAVTHCEMTSARTINIPPFVSSLIPSIIDTHESNPEELLYATVDPITGEPVCSVRSPIDGSPVQFKDRSPADFPALLNKSFSNENIDSKVYSNFGVFSTFWRTTEQEIILADGTTQTIYSSTPTAGALNDQFVAAFGQYLDYLTTTDRNGFVNFTTRRTITSISDLRFYYGSGLVPPPVFQDAWINTLRFNGQVEEYLFGAPDTGPFFKSFTGDIFTKQEVIRSLCKEMRIALAKEPTLFGNYDLNIANRRAGGVIGV